MTAFAYSTGAMLTGFILDSIFGDPQGFPHIIRVIGKLIASLEKYMRKCIKATGISEKTGGTILVIVVITICTFLPFIILYVCYRALPVLGFIIESLLCYQLLAAKSLKAESMKVYFSLMSGDIEKSRKNVSMIVGRDTADLTEKGIVRATVETVSENSSDGIAAPLFYMMIGGAALGCLYKAVNTMDSMIGYKNEKYIDFGRAAAITDDILNFIPSRICAMITVLSAYILHYDGKNAFRIWRRDRRNHASPNSAQTESACAGALGIQLAGPASYFGEVHNKPYIGDDTRPVQINDIHCANRLMYVSAILMLAFAVLMRIICMGVMHFG